MKKILLFILAGSLLLSACGNTVGKIEVRDYWTRASTKGDNGAAYMVINNGMAQDEELIGVSSNVTDTAEVQLSQMDNDVMQMMPQGSVPLAAGEDVEFKPGGLHIMLIGLNRDLNVGDEITLTLYFKNHEGITLTVPVKDAADMGSSGMDDSMP